WRIHHDDWNRGGRSLCGDDRARKGGQNHVDLALREFRCQALEPFGFALRIPRLKNDVPALDVAELAQALANSPMLARSQDADSVHLLGRLCLSTPRDREQDAKQEGQDGERRKKCASKSAHERLPTPLMTWRP